MYRGRTFTPQWPPTIHSVHPSGTAYGKMIYVYVDAANNFKELSFSTAFCLFHAYVIL